jgi:hypothetical protein
MAAPISFVLRVNPLEQETLHGQIEYVPTGITAHFHNLMQAEVFIRSHLPNSDINMQERSTGESVSSIFSFSRRPLGEEPSGTPGESTVEPDTASAEPTTAAALVSAASSDLVGGLTPSISLRQYIDELLDLLRPFVPPSTAGLPPNTLGIVSLNPRSLGLGGRRGMARSAGLDVAELRGGWLDTVIRFDIWGADATTVGDLAATLQAALANDAPELRRARLLQIRLTNTSDATETADSWRRSIDYAVLYEYHYQDTDGATSLIARVPIHGETDFSAAEVTTVTDHMVRWDELGAPALVITPTTTEVLQVAGLTVMAFLPSGGPTGAVTRTIVRGGVPEIVNFGSLSAFLSDFAVPLTPVELLTLPPPLLPGETQAIRAFESRQRLFVPPVVLRGGDRLEVRFSEAAFPGGSPSEIYLKAAVRV